MKVSRKVRRKEERKLKKAKRNEYFIARKNVFRGNKIAALTCKNSSNKLMLKEKIKKDGRKDPEEVKKNIKTTKKVSKDSLNEQMKLQRKRRLIEDNMKEDKVIKQLEKKLKMHKRTSKSVPKCFLESGLDYILDVCDNEKVKDVINEETNLLDSDSDFLNDLFATSKNVPEEYKKSTDMSVLSNSKISSDEDMCEFESDNEEMSEYASGEEDICATESGEASVLEEFRGVNENSNDGSKFPGEINKFPKNEKNVSISKNEIIEGKKKETIEDGCWEDIYGRIRTKDGRILNKNSSVYIPPHLRKLVGSKNEELEKLRRELKGFLNKLTTANMNSISLRVEELYSKHSRNSVSQTLFDLSSDAIVQQVLVKEQLIVDHAILFTVLHANVGSEVGAYLLTKFVEKFMDLYSSEALTKDKELDNLLLLICQMFNFKIFESCLIYDILKKICSSFKEKDVDLILVVLKSVGFMLRKDDPVSLKDLIISIQKLALKTSIVDNSRLKYMIEILMNIKNNNIVKVTSYNPEEREHLKKIVRCCIRKGNSVTQLNIGLEDILKAEERGRWWVVGSAWTGKERKESIKTDVNQNTFSDLILKLAKKHKMNTENRKNIFCILMTSDDPMDASERILRLGLKGQQEGEIAPILLHCLLQEKEYNKYYFYIGDHICSLNRKHKMSFQHALWDKFKILSSLSHKQISILAKFLSSMLLSGSVSLFVLKTLPFSELDKISIRFLRQTFLFLFTDGDEEEIRQVFDKIYKNNEQGLLRESLRLFVNHFILKRISEGEVKRKILMIDTLLTEIIL